MKKELRKGKVFVDWSQNDEHKTTVCVYSLRARERPDRLDAAHAGTRSRRRSRTATRTLLVFEADEVLERVDEHGDLFAPVLELEQELPGAVVVGGELEPTRLVCSVSSLKPACIQSLAGRAGQDHGDGPARFGR